MENQASHLGHSRRYHARKSHLLALSYTLVVFLLAGCNPDRRTESTPTSAGTQASSDDLPTSSEDQVELRVAIEQPDFLHQSWTVRGEVVDQTGMPVEAFDAAAIWSSNGVYWNQAGAIPEEEIPNVWKREGSLAVRPQYAAKQTSRGTFELTIRDRPRAPVFVANPERTQGGITLVDRHASDRPVRIELSPLVRVTAELVCPESEKTPEFCKAEIYVVGGDNIPLTQCGTWEGKVAFLLPPGEYEIHATSEFPSAAMRLQERPHDLPLHGKYARGLRFTVTSDASNIDLGTLELHLAKNAIGNAVDITDFYGKHPPGLELVDVLGASKQLKLEDYRGKWVLIEFWAVWCPSCIAHGLPALAAFSGTALGSTRSVSDPCHLRHSARRSRHLC